MAKISKTAVDESLRNQVFEKLNLEENGFSRINARQFGIIITDLNGVERYVRVGAIVAEIREDVSAKELMDSEIEKYLSTQEKKAEVAKANKEKAERDKAAREAKKKEKEKA